VVGIKTTDVSTSLPRHEDARGNGRYSSAHSDLPNRWRQFIITCLKIECISDKQLYSVSYNICFVIESNRNLPILPRTIRSPTMLQFCLKNKSSFTLFC